MEWGTYGLVHILSLVFAIVLSVVLYYVLKHCPKSIQIAVLGILSFSGLAAIIYNLVTWNSPLEYLPLHLCSLNALILPFAVFTRNKVIANLTLLWSLGAAVALILNYSVATTKVGGPVFCSYYFPHIFETCIPILLFKLGLCKLDSRCIVPTISITYAIYTVVHFINVKINEYCKENEIVDSAGEIIDVNYMYSIYPDNPLLDLFREWIPYEYWYMLPALGVAAIYLGIIYGIGAIVKKKKAA